MNKSPRLASLLLLASGLLHAAAPTTTYTWTGSGADALWSNATNWGGTSPLAAGNTIGITFNATTANNSVNLDTSGAIVNLLTFGGSTNYTLGGNLLTFEGAATADTVALFASGSTAVTINNNITFNSTSLGGTIQNSASGVMNVNGNIELNGKGIRFATSLTSTLKLNGIISNAGAGTVIAVTGTGTTVFGALNTYNNATTLWSGTTVFTQNGLNNQNGAFGNSASTVSISMGTSGSATNVSLLAGAAVSTDKDIFLSTYAAQTKIFTIGGNTAHLSTYAGNIYLGSGGTTTGQGVSLTAASGGRVEISGTIKRRSGTTAETVTDTVTKIGAGLVSLSGGSTAYTYEGLTTVSAGTLLVNGNLAAAYTGTGTRADLISVASGATLGGAGTIDRAITVASGGIFAPGDVSVGFVNQVGTLTIGKNLTFGAASLLNYDLASVGASDTVALTGTLTLDGTLNVTGLSGFGAGTYRLFSVSGTLIDQGLTLGTIPGGYNYAVAFNGNNVDLNVTAIPEPATTAALIGACSLAAVAVLRRRRR